jgi:6-pyruvoyl-tetrahydropterin synthase
MFIAHSLKGDVFGPASNLHGATYVVDAEFFSPQLNEDNVVVEIGHAGQALRDVLARMNYHCLDDLPEFKGINTTTECLARYVHDELLRRVSVKFKGSCKITLHESDLGSASYTAPVA